MLMPLVPLEWKQMLIFVTIAEVLFYLMSLVGNTHQWTGMLLGMEW